MARAKVTQNTEAVSPDDLLGATLSAFEAFLSEMSTGALGATEDAETRHILTTSTTSVQSQFAKVTNFAREHHSKLNVAQREEVDVFLRVQDGIQMANSGAETARAAFKTGWFKKFLQWAIHWFKEIKKVLREILAMILDALNISFPKWLETIFLLLDELYDAIVSLLTDVFGLDVGKFAAEASRAEVNYLNQLYAVERLRGLRGTRVKDEDE